MIKLLILTLLLVLPAAAERNKGNPIDHIPKNMEVLTHFGERADF